MTDAELDGAPITFKTYRAILAKFQTELPRALRDAVDKRTGALTKRVDALERQLAEVDERDAKLLRMLGDLESAASKLRKAS